MHRECLSTGQGSSPRVTAAEVPVWLQYPVGGIPYHRRNGAPKSNRHGTGPLNDTHWEDPHTRHQGQRSGDPQTSGTAALDQSHGRRRTTLISPIHSLHSRRPQVMRGRASGIRTLELAESGQGGAPCDWWNSARLASYQLRTFSRFELFSLGGAGDTGTGLWSRYPVLLLSGEKGGVDQYGVNPGGRVKYDLGRSPQRSSAGKSIALYGGSRWYRRR